MLKPLPEEESLRRGTDARDRPPALVEAGRGETVLVVEDEKAVRELTGCILAENGYRVIHAADGYRARILCDQFQGEIDCCSPTW